LGECVSSWLRGCHMCFVGCRVILVRVEVLVLILLRGRRYNYQLQVLNFHTQTSKPPLENIVTCSGHPPRCWPRSLQLDLRYEERDSTASPEKLAL
jgi:hypothetical protein